MNIFAQPSNISNTKSVKQEHFRTHTKGNLAAFNGFFFSFNVGYKLFKSIYEEIKNGCWDKTFILKKSHTHIYLGKKDPTPLSIPALKIGLKLS